MLVCVFFTKRQPRLERLIYERVGVHVLGCVGGSVVWRASELGDPLISPERNAEKKLKLNCLLEEIRGVRMCAIHQFPVPKLRKGVLSDLD